jgi:hypothetical protein
MQEVKKLHGLKKLHGRVWVDSSPRTQAAPRKPNTGTKKLAPLGSTQRRSQPPTAAKTALRGRAPTRLGVSHGAARGGGNRPAGHQSVCPGLPRPWTPVSRSHGRGGLSWGSVPPTPNKEIPKKGFGESEARTPRGHLSPATGHDVPCTARPLAGHLCHGRWAGGGSKQGLAPRTPLQRNKPK